MPLCMKQLHSALNREHKLKHWGRLQYGLFLKGAGLSVDDAMAFWQVLGRGRGSGRWSWAWTVGVEALFVVLPLKRVTSI